MTDAEKVGPVDHITRAVLPWRTSVDMAECGKSVIDLAGRLVTRDEARARVERLGQQRAAFTLCMTCASTSDRHSQPEMVDAVAAVARYVSAASRAWPPHGQRESPAWKERQHLNTELDAVAALVAAHREEFDGYLSGREQTVSLADRRRRAVVRRASGPDYLGGA